FEGWPFHQVLGTQGIRAWRVRRTSRHLRWWFPRMGIRRRPQKQSDSGVRPGRQLHRRVETIRAAEFSIVGKDDTIYVGASFPDPSAKKAEMRGIMIGTPITGSLKAFIPAPADLDKVIAGTSASGIAADSMGSVFAADVGAHNLRKYIKVKIAGHDR